MRSTILACTILILCTVLPSCSSGPKVVKVTGKLQRNDQPLKVDSKGSVTVVFTPIFEGRKKTFDTYTGIYRSESPTFEIPGPDGNGIPEGKYKISLLAMVPQPTAEIHDINERFNAQNTPIVREIRTSETLVIDLGKAKSK
jgi:hypothetical protein